MSESKGKIVIALGGNALQSGKGPATAEAQLEVVKNTCKRVAEISGMGYEIAVVHGNGVKSVVYIGYVVACTL